MYSDGPHIFYLKDCLQENYYDYAPFSSYGKIREKAIPYENPAISWTSLGINRDIPIVEEYRPDNCEYKDVNRIAAFGDIHGNFESLVAVLKNGGIIDKNLNWTFGDGHLVFCGDIFDRGDQVTECLWFIFFLEQEAEIAGGKLHLLLGNHELMALNNDIRYLHDKYLYMASIFQSRYSDFFGTNSVLGRWLRSKPAAIRINDYIFVHGGLSPTLAEANLTIQSINEIVRKNIDENKPEDLVFGIEGPFWYRGYMMNWQGHGLITKKETKEVLEFYKTSKIIFAHTPARKIKAIHDALIAIDIEIHNNEHYEYLFIEYKNFYAVDFAGNRRKII